jgi:hypothetical protein
MTKRGGKGDKIQRRGSLIKGWPKEGGGKEGGGEVVELMLKTHMNKG